MRRPLPECLQRTQSEALYASHDYLDAYRRHTEMRVRHDHQAAVGGLWEEIGRLQLDYLAANGLQPHHSLLDIGCGTPRACRHFIPYLEAGRYTGFDLSPAAINIARRLILTERRPRLFVNCSGELTFPYSQRYDFLLAHGVFTNLPEANIEVAIALSAV
jgi:SAM-dependent methyltransferase